MALQTSTDSPLAEVLTNALGPLRLEKVTLLLYPRARVSERKELGARVYKERMAPCKSPLCAGCYDVGDGKRIHPPKCGEGWLDRWKPKEREPLTRQAI